MPILLLIAFFLLGAEPALAQTHQHGAAAVVDGNFNPSLVSDKRGGCYLAYIKRANGVTNVMLRHSLDGKTFSPPVRLIREFARGCVMMPVWHLSGYLGREDRKIE